jgi:hypothetical protein
MIQELERNDDSQYRGDTDDTTDSMEIGDHFAVIAEDNNDGVPYYILQCGNANGQSFLLGKLLNAFGVTSLKLGITFWRAFTFRIGELDPKTTCTSVVHVQLSFILI